MPDPAKITSLKTAQTEHLDNIAAIKQAITDPGLVQDANKAATAVFVEKVYTACGGKKSLGGPNTLSIALD